MEVEALLSALARIALVAPATSVTLIAVGVTASAAAVHRAAVETTAVEGRELLLM